ncbi:hypothetical protein ACFQX8_08985 [Klenkia terrae]|uniref:hypothetical protein n=1 Tax=Klenkia terrae TaxID=1052259 RepID=UPI003615F705
MRTNKQGHLVREALGAVGVPAVMAGGGSVFGTAAARAWLVLLEALEQPHRAGRVRAAALTVFLPVDEATLDARGDALTDELGPGCAAGPTCSPTGVWPRSPRCSPPSRACPPGCWPARTASAC